MMSSEAFATFIVAGTGMTLSWGVWVSVSIFKLTQEIALIKQEIKLLDEVRNILEDIRMQMKDKNHGG